MLFCPFSPNSPYISDRITRDGRNSTKRICDMDSCNDEMIMKSEMVTCM